MPGEGVSFASQKYLTYAKAAQFVRHSILMSWSRYSRPRPDEDSLEQMCNYRPFFFQFGQTNFHPLAAEVIHIKILDDLIFSCGASDRESVN
jgi:hypothetical protein